MEALPAPRREPPDLGDVLDDGRPRVVRRLPAHLQAGRCGRDEGRRRRGGRAQVQVRDRHRDVRGHGQRTDAAPAGGGDRHLVGVGVAARAAARILEIRRRREAQPGRAAHVRDLEPVRVGTGQAIRHGVAGVRVCRRDRDHRPLVLGNGEGEARGEEGGLEGGRGVDAGGCGGRGGPAALALGAVRPHAHLVARVRRQVPDGGARARHPLRAVLVVVAGPRLAVLEVVVLDRRPRVGRRPPRDVQAGPRRPRDARRGRPARRLQRVSHRDRVVPRRAEGVRPTGGGHRQPVGVGAARAALRALEVGRSEER